MGGRKFAVFRDFCHRFGVGVAEGSQHESEEEADCSHYQENHIARVLAHAALPAEADDALNSRAVYDLQIVGAETADAAESVEQCGDEASQAEAAVELESACHFVTKMPTQMMT